MMKSKKMLAVVLTLCMLVTTMVSVPVMANTGGSEVTKWVSSEYLNPDNPITVGNPWSVKSTNNASGVWETVTNTTPVTYDGFHLFPMMPDGNQPTTGYISNGNFDGSTWGVHGVNMAVNGKYMIAGERDTGDNKGTTATAKIAKVFTAPKTGVIKISAGATVTARGNITQGMIVPVKTITDGNNNIAWSVEKNGAELWRKTGYDRKIGNDGGSGYSYDSVWFDSQFVNVAAGDEVYFIFHPSDWNYRDGDACMWDPIVEYVASAVADEDNFVSSEYLNPDVYYLNNPWSVETNDNSDLEWKTVTNTTENKEDPEWHGETAFSLFPDMADGITRTTGFVSSGIYENGLNGGGYSSVNAAVSGKCMVPASKSAYEDTVLPATKVAKVFTAPKDGMVLISFGETVSGSNGMIVPNKVTDSWMNDNLSYTIEKNDVELWKKTGHDRLVGQNGGSGNTVYDSIWFDSMYVSVSRGEKIRFILTATEWNTRGAQACLWDPIINYVQTDVAENNNFVSSKYLNPDKYYANNPWSVKAKNNAEGVWKTVTNTTETKELPEWQEKITVALFPTMPDGVTPTTGYISTGTYSDGISINMAVNGKYMIPGSMGVGTNSVSASKCEVAKVFTAPRTGLIKISAGATIGAGSEGKIVTGHSEGWNNESKKWSINKNNSEVITEKVGYINAVAENGYDTISVDDYYINVSAGDEIYFTLWADNYVPRAEAATMWDPVVSYIYCDIGDAACTDNTVVLDVLKVNDSLDSNKKIIAAAYDNNGILIGSQMQSFGVGGVNADSDITILNLKGTPSLVKVFIWDFGNNGEDIIPIDKVIERIPTSS